MKLKIRIKKTIALIMAISLFFSAFLISGCSRNKEENGKETTTNDAIGEDLRKEPDGGEQKTETITSAAYVDIKDFFLGGTYHIVKLAENMKSYFGITGEDIGFEYAGMEQIGENRYYTVRETYKGTVVYGAAVTFVIGADGTFVGYSSKLVNVVSEETAPEEISLDDTKEIIEAFENKQKTIEFFSFELNEAMVRYYVGESYEGFVYSVNAYTDGIPYEYLIDAENKEVLLSDCMVSSYKVAGEDIYIYDANGNQVNDTHQRYMYDKNQNKYTAIPGGFQFKTESGETAFYDKETNSFYSEEDTERSNPLGELAYIDDCFELSSKNGTPLNEKVADNDTAKLLENYAQVSKEFYNKYFERDGFSGQDGKVYLTYNWTHDKYKGGMSTNAPGFNATLLQFEGENVKTDVFGHEYAHSVESSISDLENNGESGSIKEALSDVFGELFQDFHQDGELDGDDIDWKNDYRDLSDPEKGKLPSRYEGKYYNDDVDEIYNRSTVISHMLYNMANGEGEKLTLEELAHLLYNTMFLLKYYKNCTFEEFCENLLLAANEMGLSEEKLEKIVDCFESAGIEYDNMIDVYSNDSKLEVLDKNGDPLEEYDVIIDGNTTSSTGIPEKFQKTVTCNEGTEMPLNLKNGVYTLKFVVPGEDEAVMERRIAVNEDGQKRNITFETDIVPVADTTEKDTTDKNEPDDDPTPDKNESSTVLADSPYLIRYQGGSGKYGYVDIRTGKVVISDKYYSADPSFGDDGYALVQNKKDGDKFLIDTKGKKAADVPDGSSRYYYEDKYLVVFDDDNVGHIYCGKTETAQIKLDCRDEDEVRAWRVSHSNSSDSIYTPYRFIVVTVTDFDEKVTYIWFDENGNQLYETDNKSGCLFNDGETLYYIDNFCNVTQLDSAGEAIKTFVLGKPYTEYGKVVGSSQNYPMVRYDGDRFYIKLNGRIYTNGFEEVTAKSLYDPSGRLNRYFFDVNDGIILTQGYMINAVTGKEISTYSESCSGFVNGYAELWESPTVGFDGMHTLSGFVDKNGVPVYQFDTTVIAGASHAFMGGYFCFRNKDGLYGIMNVDGTVICKAKYKSLYSFT